MEFKMVKCTVQEVNCAPQRLLWREGEVDLKQKRGHNINTAPITLTHGDYKIQTCTNTPPPTRHMYAQSAKYIIAIKSNVLQTWEETLLQKQIYPAVHNVRKVIWLVHFGITRALIKFPHLTKCYKTEAWTLKKGKYWEFMLEIQKWQICMR